MYGNYLAKSSCVFIGIYYWSRILSAYWKDVQHGMYKKDHKNL